MSSMVFNLDNPTNWKVTSSVHECRDYIKSLENGESNVTEENVSQTVIAILKILSGIASEPDLASLEGQINGENLAKALIEINPKLDWRKIFDLLDDKELKVTSPRGLIVVTSILRTAYPDPKTFPIECLYRIWNNKKNHLSWISTIVSNSDIFTFEDYRHTPINSSAMKVQPPDTKDLGNWKCQEFYELIFHYIDITDFTRAIYQIFQRAACQACNSELLVLGMIQSIPPKEFTQTRRNLMKALIQTLIMSNSPSPAVVNVVWNWPGWEFTSDTPRLVIKQVFADIYTNSPDEQKLTRTLEIAHELKPDGLTDILESGTNREFILNLAFLAARRDYLKLDTYLETMIDRALESSDDTFIFELIRVVKKKINGPQGLNSVVFTRDTINTIYNVLMSKVSKDRTQTVKNAIRELIQATKEREGIIKDNNATLVQQQQIASTVSSNDNFNRTPVNRPIYPPMATSQVNQQSIMMRNMLNMRQGIMNPPMTTGQNIAALGPSDGSIKKEFITEITGNEDLTSYKFEQHAQDKANILFQTIYSPTGVSGVRDFIDKLKHCKNSTKSEDKEVLLCVIKSLFEEYQYFKDYPPRELRVTAEVYGLLIKENIVTGQHQTFALNRIYESVREKESPLYTFGLSAIAVFIEKLPLYVNFCKALTNYPHFKTWPSDLRTLIMNITNGVPIDRLHMSISKNVTDNGTPGRQSASISSLANVDTLVKATEGENSQCKNPPKEVIEKVGFIMNNLAENNLKEKATDLKEFIKNYKEDFCFWFARYLVVHRIAIEVNHHKMYSMLLKEINSETLDDMIKKETFRSITILLRLDTRIKNQAYADRQTLKNMGNWLGMITIARDKPIVSCDLDLKSLLLEAYVKGEEEMAFVIPFITRVISSSAKSTLFDAKCAWISSILCVLAEMYCESSLKLNLKFEIEVLCNELDLKMGDIIVGKTLKNTELLKGLPSQMGKFKKIEPEAITALSPMPINSRVPQMSTNSNPLSVPPNIIPFVAQEVEIVPPIESLYKFQFHDVSMNVVDFFTKNCAFPQNNVIIQAIPVIKRTIYKAMSDAIVEMKPVIFEKALKHSLAVTECLLKKDFIFETSIPKIKEAAYNLMRSSTAALVAVNVKDHMAQTLMHQLKTQISGAVQSSDLTFPKEQLITLIDILVKDLYALNEELITCIAIKNAVDKGAVDVTRMVSEYLNSRYNVGDNKLAPAANARAIQNLLPDELKFNEEGISANHYKIYENLAHTVCGFKYASANPIEDFKVETLPMPQNIFEPDTMSKNILVMLRCLNNIIQYHQTNSQSFPHVKAFQGLGGLRTALSSLLSSPKNPANLIASTKAMVEYFMTGYELELYSKNKENKQLYLFGLDTNTKLRDIFLNCIQQLTQHVRNHEIINIVTKTVCDRSPELLIKEIPAIEVLCKSGLINPKAMDCYFAKKINEKSVPDINFCSRMNAYFSMDAKFYHYFSSSFMQIVITLKKYNNATASNRETPTPGMMSLPESIDGGMFNGQDLSQYGLPIDKLHQYECTLNISATSTFGESPSQIALKAEKIFREWLKIVHLPEYSSRNVDLYKIVFQLMNDEEVFTSDEILTEFLFCTIHMCVDLSKRLDEVFTGLMNPTVLRQRHHRHLDAFVKLIYLFVKFGDATSAAIRSKIFISFCAIFTRSFVGEYNTNEAKFLPHIYHRMMLMLFCQLTRPDSELESISLQICETFGQLMFTLQPKTYPLFVYVWMDILAHRNVMSAYLDNDGTSPESIKKWSVYAQLLSCGVKFLAPFIAKNVEMKTSIQHLYSGLLKLLLVLLHDFPDLLSEYYFKLVDHVPIHCTQIRNIILSAYPKSQILPDPFTTNLAHFEALPEMRTDPKFHLQFNNYLPTVVIKQLDEFLETRTNVDFLSQLPSLCRTHPPNSNPESKYNISFINALVLYVGVKAIEYLNNKNVPIVTAMMAHSSYMDVLESLAVSLDPEGRYIFFSAMANNLRHPCSHTLYFSKAFLYLFKEVGQLSIQEQLTRTLFERIICLRPHPWGLLVTFIELIRNPTYNFWSHSFVTCAPELNRLLSCVSNSVQTKGSNLELSSTTGGSSGDNSRSAVEAL
uniref:CCR4-NOT transcription complex subunit 1 n=1 Tax=Parastrongyloides trichosuri TaxID=131310 RepID=A0A0N4Z2P1_PARTI